MRLPGRAEARPNRSLSTRKPRGNTRRASCNTVSAYANASFTKAADILEICPRRSVYSAHLYSKRNIRPCQYGRDKFTLFIPHAPFASFFRKVRSFVSFMRRAPYNGRFRAFQKRRFRTPDATENTLSVSVSYIFSKS